MIDDPRQRHGDHTWDIVITYHCCPACGNIIENRQKFERRVDLYEKDLVCDRCQHAFTVTKKIRPTFGPLFGND